MIWLIALVPAILVILVAVWTGSKAATILAASMAMLFGLFTGSPAYAALDLGAVAVATLFAWNTVSFQPRNPARKAAKAAEAAEVAKKLDALGDAALTTYLWIVGALCAIGLIWFLILQPKAPAVSAYKPALTPSLPLVIAPTVAIVSTPTRKPQGQVQRRKVSSMAPMRKCVEIVDEAKMLTCLEGLP